MFRKLTIALIATSVVAAPLGSAFAAQRAHAAPASTTQAPMAEAIDTSSNMLAANAYATLEHSEALEARQ